MAKKKNRGLRFFIILIVIVILGFVVYKSLPTIQRKYFYPKEYSQYVEKYSKKYNIDENFIYSVIKVESNFKPNAESNVGAAGLMQLMEIAYQAVYDRIDDNQGLKYSDMYDPEYNIMYGTYYLHYLYDIFGTYELTIAAYHAGLTAVSSWLEDGTIDKDNFDVSKVPISDTRHYITKIISAYNKYNELYR